MDRTQKKATIGQYAKHTKDTGSPEVQVAILTGRIESLKNHLEIHRNDNHSRRGIMLMVAKRRRLLDYLKRIDLERYNSLIESLGLRK